MKFIGIFVDENFFKDQQKNVRINCFIVLYAPEVHNLQQKRKSTFFLIRNSSFSEIQEFVHSLHVDQPHVFSLYITAIEYHTATKMHGTVYTFEITECCSMDEHTGR